MAEDNVRYSFKVEWFDTVASLLRPYELYYFPHDKTLEMYDKKNKRGFLKRCEYPTVQMKDIFIGATIAVYSRQLKVVDYADEFTAKAYGPKRSRCLALVLPDGYEQLGKTLDHCISARGCVLAQIKMVRLTRAQAETLFARESGTPEFADKVRRAASNTCVACELVCEDSIRTLNADAQLAAHTRAGALHLSQSDADALAEVGFFFSAAGAKALEPTTARLANSTAVVIKPHALAAGLAGKIIDAFLDEGFFVSAIESMAIDKIAAEEFFEVYKGVAPEYAGMIDTITAGPVIALEICGADAVEKVRAFVGPFDPEIARHIRPRTLRARFGVDKLRNAVHATDLPEDGVLEAEYLFQILKAAGPK